MFSLSKYLPEDGQKRSKRVGGLLYPFVSSFCAGDGMNTKKSQVLMTVV